MFIAVHNSCFWEDGSMNDSDDAPVVVGSSSTLNSWLQAGEIGRKEGISFEMW